MDLPLHSLKRMPSIGEKLEQVEQLQCLTAVLEKAPDLQCVEIISLTTDSALHAHLLGSSDMRTSRE